MLLINFWNILHWIVTYNLLLKFCVSCKVCHRFLKLIFRAFSILSIFMNMHYLQDPISIIFMHKMIYQLNNWVCNITWDSLRWALCGNSESTSCTHLCLTMNITISLDELASVKRYYMILTYLDLSYNLRVYSFIQGEDWIKHQSFF